MWKIRSLGSYHKHCLFLLTGKSMDTKVAQSASFWRFISKLNPRYNCASIPSTGSSNMCQKKKHKYVYVWEWGKINFKLDRRICQEDICFCFVQCLNEPSCKRPHRAWCEVQVRQRQQAILPPNLGFQRALQKENSWSQNREWVSRVTWQEAERQPGKVAGG